MNLSILFTQTVGTCEESTSIRAFEQQSINHYIHMTHANKIYLDLYFNVCLFKKPNRKIKALYMHTRLFTINATMIVLQTLGNKMIKSIIKFLKI